MFLRNVGYHSTHYTASYPRRRYSFVELNSFSCLSVLCNPDFIRSSNRIRQTPQNTYTTLCAYTAAVADFLAPRKWLTFAGGCAECSSSHRYRGDSDRQRTQHIYSTNTLQTNLPQITADAGISLRCSARIPDTPVNSLYSRAEVLGEQSKAAGIEVLAVAVIRISRT
jgi:hypothetical protein